MIIDYHGDPDAARLYSIVAADTGECLDREGIFFADDEAGYYHRHLIDGTGGKYIWDRRTRERRSSGEFRAPIPEEHWEVAWERVDRAIRLVPKPVCCWCGIDLMPGERFGCRECCDCAERNGKPVHLMRRTNIVPPRHTRSLMAMAEEARAREA